jgi:P27 family predicted phage terminase small subunit
MKQIKPEPYLSDAAKKHFTRIVNHLDSVDALSGIDSYGLSMMSQYLQMYHEASEEVESTGSWQVFKNGASNVSGAFSVMEKCMTQFLKFSEKFGLSPKDRERMLKFQNKKSEEIDPLQQLTQKYES